jgi:mannose-6-phosphate isomerase-like protein (cupin superfamily)
MKEKGQIFYLDNLLSKMDRGSTYWIDFIKVRNLEAGVLRLHPSEEDTQGPHESDELYFVIDGSGYIKMGEQCISVKKGSILFVPAGMAHHFYGNKDTLVVLYMFAQ